MLDEARGSVRGLTRAIVIGAVIGGAVAFGGRYLFHAVLTFLRPDSYLSSDVQPLVLALVVAVGGFVALVGAVMRAAAHGHGGEKMKRYDLTGKHLAVAAGIIASLGATGALPVEVGLAVAALETVALVILCIVLARTMPTSPSDGATSLDVG